MVLYVKLRGHQYSWMWIPKLMAISSNFKPLNVNAIVELEEKLGGDTLSGKHECLYWTLRLFIKQLRYFSLNQSGGPVRHKKPKEDLSDFLLLLNGWSEEIKERHLQ